MAPPRQGPEGQRWGALREIDYRTKVASEAWFGRHPRRILHLSSHRYMHELAEHDALPDNFENTNLQTKLALIRRLETESAEINSTIEQVNRNVRGLE